MTTRYIYRYALVCDSCGAEHAPLQGFESTTEARAAGYVEGWRFPHRRTKSGGQASRTNDLCPSCWSDRSTAPPATA